MRRVKIGMLSTYDQEKLRLTLLWHFGTIDPKDIHNQLMVLVEDQEHIRQIDFDEMMRESIDCDEGKESWKYHN